MQAYNRERNHISKDPLLQNMRLCRHQNGRESLQAFLFEELFALEAALKNEWPLSGVVFQRLLQANSQKNSK